MYDTIFIGSGPAGVGPLVAAAQRNLAGKFLARGILWLDSRNTFGSGALGDHAILSDTVSDVLLECLKHEPLRERLATLAQSGAATEVRTFADGPLPLDVAARFLGTLGASLKQHFLDAEGPSHAILETRARHIVKHATHFEVHVTRAGAAHSYEAKRIVFAMGGTQSRSELLNRTIGQGIALAPEFSDKTWITSELFTVQGQARLASTLPRSPRVVVLGGSHSAITTCWLLLNRFPGHEFATHPIEVLYRRPPKIFYPTAEAARLDRYTDVQNTDICPVTGRVHRLGGLRLSARELAQHVMGLGDRPRETRVRLARLQDHSEASLRAKLQDADMIVAAFGYKPQTIPMYHATDSATDAAIPDAAQRVALACETLPNAPLVDGDCRVLDAALQPIAGMYGIGLASGFVPHGAMGGEPSFQGQTNGLWLYQNDVGSKILDALMA